MALPSFYDLDDPSSNLAAAFDVPKAIPTPAAKRYLVGDGTTIGYGGTCDPITDGPMLSGLDLYDVTDYVPEVLQDNRVTWMEAFSMPLAVAALTYAMDKRPLVVAGLAAASYMAPYPAALAVAFTVAGPKIRELRERREGRNRRVSYKPLRRAPRTRNRRR